MSKQALLAVAFLLAAVALSPTPAGAADVNVGGGAGLTIGIGAPDWGAETARAQEQAQRHSQFVQMSTQLMGELQNSERELIDVLQTMKRDADNLRQSHGAMRDSGVSHERARDDAPLKHGKEEWSCAGRHGGSQCAFVA